jgi:hypothetical protein
MGRPINKAKLREIEVVDMLDAKVPFKYIVTRDHVWGSRSKCRIAGPASVGSFNHCVQENAINSMPGVLESKFYKTVLYIRFVNNPHIAVRYLPSQDGKVVAEINDKKGKKALLKMLKNPMELWCEVPRYNRSLEYSRSDTMKQVRKESRERRAGMTPGSYDNPTRKGFRNGTGSGRAHMWEHPWAAR